MGAVLSIAGMALLLLVMAFFLWRGKGSWLIAGYNTASQAERDKYDKKKLCRVMAGFCFLLALLFIVMATLGYKVEVGLLPESVMGSFGLIFTLLLMAGVGWLRYYTNTKCKK